MCSSRSGIRRAKCRWDAVRISFYIGAENLPVPPHIFVTSVLTHLCGGSAGREARRFSLGGSISGNIGHWDAVDDRDSRTITMCGMAAGFAALFGTPLAATVFAMEVISVGVMYYAALFHVCTGVADCA